MRRREFIDDAVERWSRLKPNRDLSSLAVVQRLIWAGRIAEEQLEKAAAASGTRRRGDYEVLALLRRSEPELQRPADLASQLLTSPSGLTSKLDRLEQSGLVERVDDEVDRRSVLIRLTDRGRTLVDSAFDVTLDLYDTFLTGLRPEDREELDRLLSFVVERLELLATTRRPWKAPSG